MKLGIDLDNTIVNYEKIFNEIGKKYCDEKSLTNKEALSNHLRSTNREKQWTKIQGEVYGPRMQEAEIALGFKEALLSCKNKIEEVVIISHRTYYPSAGGKYDLHQVAHNWIRTNITSNKEFSELKISIIFEVTLDNKINSIINEEVNIFIDDHLGVLTNERFPKGVYRIHYSGNKLALDPIITMKCWSELPSIIDQFGL